MPEIYINAEAQQVKQLNGVDHVVVPVVMLVEGVVNNKLALVSEFGKFVDSWNGRPVPVYHPERNGEAISANSPDIIDKSVGFIFNARIDGTRLLADAWLNSEKIKGTELEARIQNNEIIEVSTGYFCDIEQKTGTHNGVQYDGIQRNFRPDHLAILPDEIGACSAADGCGLVRNKLESLLLKVTALTVGKAPTTNCKGVSQCNCKSNGGAIMPITTNELSEEQKEILALIAQDPESLKEALEILMPEEEEVAPAEPDVDETPAVNVAQLVAEAVKEEMRRQAAVSQLATNKSNPFSVSEMAAMSVEHLEKLAASLRPVDYSGQGGFNVNSQEKAQPLSLPKGLLSAGAK